MNVIHQHNAINPWPVPEKTLNTIITSPPYWAKRDYGHPDQLGQEGTPEGYVRNIVDVFGHAWNALRNDGTLWLNLGDTYMGGKGKNGASIAYSKHVNAINKKALMTTTPGTIRPNDVPHPTLKAKQLVGIPWRVALALQAEGWILRDCIIWHKPNCMPESVPDRCTNAYEFLFLFAKQPKYYFNAKAIREPAIYTNEPGYDGSGFKDARQYSGKNSKNSLIRNSRKPVDKEYDGMRNKRNVWTIPVANYTGDHFAVFPDEIPYYCIQAGCPPGGIVGDSFMGVGTTAMVARMLGMNYWGMELNPKNIEQANSRIAAKNGLFK